MPDEKNVPIVNQAGSVISDVIRSNQDVLCRQDAFGLREDRELYGIFKYPQDPTVDTYLEQFRRGLGSRIIRAYTEATWREFPEVKQGGNKSDDETEFDKTWLQLVKKLKIPHYFEREDQLQSLGRYGVLYIGTSDAKTNEHLKSPVENLNSIDDILYLMPFSESNAVVTKLETTSTNPRYGLPVEYKLTMGGEICNSETKVNQTVDILVHWTRVIHVAEGLLENDVYGTPRLEASLNNLFNLEKVVGGGAEMFWLNGRGALHADVDPEVANLDDGDLATAKEDFKRLAQQLERYMVTFGVDMKPINFEVHSPKDHFDTIMSTLSGITGIPKRILMGSESGSLASSQDENNWLNRVSERQEKFAGPLMVEPMVDRFILFGILDDVDYSVEWSVMSAVSELEQADIALKKSQSISTYSAPQMLSTEQIVTPKQFVEEVLNMEYLEEDISNIRSELDVPEDAINTPS